MPIRWTTITNALSALALATMFAGTASAGCGYQPERKGPGLKGARLELQPWQSKIQFKPAAFVLVDNDQDPVVGMWKVQFLVNGGVFDFGYSQWHGDGTEILNSGARAPATENFCLGVWKKTGHNTYKLNHFALSYDAGTGALNATVNIRENITLDHSGDSYAGTFTIDVFAPDGTPGPHIAGTITGTRVTAD